MPIDSSIYNQGNQLDIGGSLERGMRLGDMIKKRRQDNEIKDIMKSGMTQNPDGSMSYDYKKPMSALLEKGYNQEAWDLQEKQNAQQAASLKQQTERSKQTSELLNNTLYNIENAKTPEERQRAYAYGLNQGKAMGLDVSQMSPNFTPEVHSYLKNAAGYATDAKFKQDQQNNDRNYQLQVDKFEFDKTKEKNAKQSGEKLPIDSKKVIETLASKNATKISIKNQIDAVMANWDELPEDQKIAAGRQLLKTLNSTEGADAIGVEEANRLGSKLEYALGNFTNSNPTQFGRDLEGFKQQAMNTSKGIGDAIEANKRQIDSAYGRPPAPQTKKPQTVAQTKAPVLKTSEIEWK